MQFKKIEDFAFFQHFYRKLLESVYKTLLENSNNIKIREESPLVWDRLDDVFFKNTFKAEDKRYFYKKNRDAVNQKEFPINDYRLSAALKYLKVDIAENNNNLKIFLEKQIAIYKNQYNLLENKDTSLKDPNNNDSIEIGRNKKFNSNEITNNSASLLTSSPEEVIKDFYKQVSIRSFNNAWSLLSVNFKERIWNSEFDRFVQGYCFLRSIKKLEVFSKDSISVDSDYNLEFMVYYETDMDLPIIDELLNLRNLQIGERDKFSEILSSFVNKMKSLGIKEIDKYSISRLFRLGVVDYLWFNSKINPEMLKLKFDFKSKSGNPNLMRCGCILTENGWKIDRIVPLIV